MTYSERVNLHRLEIKQVVNTRGYILTTRILFYFFFINVKAKTVHCFSIGCGILNQIFVTADRKVY